MAEAATLSAKYTSAPRRAFCASGGDSWVPTRRGCQDSSGANPDSRMAALEGRGSVVHGCTQQSHSVDLRPALTMMGDDRVMITHQIERWRSWKKTTSFS